jgi:hypothetical protein
MVRSARAERVGEAYAEYARATYEDSGVLEETENVSLFNGGFEIAYVGARFCLLTDFGESGRQAGGTWNICGTLIHL